MAAIFSKTISNATTAGLREKPSYEELIKYVREARETIRYPNRDATLLANSFEMSQMVGEGFRELDMLNAGIQSSRVDEGLLRKFSAQEGLDFGKLKFITDKYNLKPALSMGSEPIPIPDILGGPDFYSKYKKMKGEGTADYGKSDPPTVEDDMGGPFTCPAYDGTYTCPAGGMFSNKTYDDSEFADARMKSAEDMADEKIKASRAEWEAMRNSTFSERGREHAPEGTPEERGSIFHDLFESLKRDLKNPLGLALVAGASVAAAGVATVIGGPITGAIAGGLARFAPAVPGAIAYGLAQISGPVAAGMIAGGAANTATSIAGAVGLPVATGPLAAGIEIASMVGPRNIASGVSGAVRAVDNLGGRMVGALRGAVGPDTASMAVARTRPVLPTTIGRPTVYSPMNSPHGASVFDMSPASIRDPLTPGALAVRNGRAPPMSPDIRDPLTPGALASRFPAMNMGDVAAYREASEAMMAGRATDAQRAIMARGAPLPGGGFVTPRAGTSPMAAGTPARPPPATPPTLPIQSRTAYAANDVRNPAYNPYGGTRVPPDVVTALYAHHNPGSITARTASPGTIHFYVGTPTGAASPAVRTPIVDRMAEARQAQILSQASAEAEARMAGSSGLRGAIGAFTTSPRAEALSSSIAAAEAQRAAAAAAGRDGTALGRLNAALEESLARYNSGEATTLDTNRMRTRVNYLHRKLWGNQGRMLNQQEMSEYERLTGIFKGVGKNLKAKLTMNHRGERMG